MIDSAALLGDLRRELPNLVADLAERVREAADVRERLEGEWRKAFDAERTGRTFEVWLEDRLTQVGVGWLLGCVFVRFGEDNNLITEARIAGPGVRGRAARAAQQAYFVTNPNHSDRDYLQHVFRDAATLSGLGGVLAEGESPLWLVDPPADACTRMIELFRAVDESGDLVHDFTDPALDTRFLGDLYEDLSEDAKSTYALLQTPEFVEEFILDRTLTPAIELFGLASTTLIDPTCGSGHFLLGAFERLCRAWRDAEPGLKERVVAQRALDAVTGVDLNPFAASIAHFRLLVAALKECGIRDLRGAPGFNIDVVVGDSLLWGAFQKQLPGLEYEGHGQEGLFLYRTEHAKRLQRVFVKQYSAVVGNPPYIIARDKALNAQYRARYPKSCSGKYSLAAPFMECFFDLAFNPDGLGRPAGHVGMITANSFMKREFGKKLIKQCIPTWDLTHVIDTSGAYIPGHGTPTVILFGRHQAPVQPVVRTVMGIRGEPSTPAEPAKGLVWRAIVDQIDEPGSESDFISVSDTDRVRFAKHPWSIGGGGAAELKERLGSDRSFPLADSISSVGFHAITGEDDLFTGWTSKSLSRVAIGSTFARPFGSGDAVRDWSIDSVLRVLFPYDENGEFKECASFRRIAWPYRTNLAGGLMFGKTRAQRGLGWGEYVTFSQGRSRTPLSIAFAFVATHNHFVLDRGGKVFNRSAPVIKLPEGAGVDEHLELLGLLNSSVACFWARQVFHDKGNGGYGGGIASEDWERFFEHDGTKLQQFPLPKGDSPVGLARMLDSLATELATLQPSAVCAAAAPSRAGLDAARAASQRLLAEMVAAQEELDWACLHLYGITDDPLTVPPSETAPPLALGERAFEIVLARRMAAGDVETAWFTRHRSTPITEIPAHWPGWYRDLVERRIKLIETDRDVGLVERPEHKRRWAREPWEKLEERALRDWLADRLEDRQLWFEGTGIDERAVCRSVAQLADRVVTLLPAFMDVARLWKGAIEIDPVAVIGELTVDEHVPAQAGARYKNKGFDTRRQWERTWELQRLEDRGGPLPDGLDRIPVPPKYTSADFAKASYWKARGKLDVPKERFVSVACAERDADKTMVLAWAGFDHAELAQAVATVLHERTNVDGWDAERTWPLIVALAELLPWLAQWHGDIDPRYGASLADLYQGIAEQAAQAAGRNLADAPAWRPPTKQRKRKAAKKAAPTEDHA